METFSFGLCMRFVTFKFHFCRKCALRSKMNEIISSFLLSFRVCVFFLFDSIISFIIFLITFGFYYLFLPNKIVVVIHIAKSWRCISPQSYYPASIHLDEFPIWSMDCHSISTSSAIECYVSLVHRTEKANWSFTNCTDITKWL